MAICEGFEPEGISQEARCAREWAAYLNITGDADPFAALIAHFGDEEGNRLADRAKTKESSTGPIKCCAPQ